MPNLTDGIDLTQWRFHISNINCLLYNNNNNNIILYSQSGIEHVHVQYKTYKEKKNKKYTNNWQFPVQIVQDMYHNSVNYSKMN